MTNTNIPTTGFHTNPERINKKGAPKREWTWAGLLEAVGDEIEAKSGLKFKDLVTKRLWIEAVNGNIMAQKEIMNRMDGMPQQKTDITSDGKQLPIYLVGGGYGIPEVGQANATPKGSDQGSAPLQDNNLAQKSEENDNSDKRVDTSGTL
jgi:hypothetical protein